MVNFDPACLYKNMNLYDKTIAKHNNADPEHVCVHFTKKNT
jgi:hypothetical protein